MNEETDLTDLTDLTVGVETPLMYFINLDGAEDRRTHFLSQVKQFKRVFRITRIPAINGMTHQFSENELAMFQNYKSQWFFCNSSLTKKIMGNQLSHYYILNDVVKNNHPYAIIVQDDVVFKKDFETYIISVLKACPSNAEIINLGYHKEAWGAHFLPLDLNDKQIENTHSVRQINDSVCVMSEHINPCSLAYIVTLKGARNLMEYFNLNGFKRETDHNFNEYLVSKNIFYASTPILCTGNHHFPSSIFL